MSKRDGLKEVFSDIVVWQKKTKQIEPTKLQETISFLMGTLKQYNLYLEECLGMPLTEKQQLNQILEIVQVEKSVPKRAAANGWGERFGSGERLLKSL